MKTIIFSAILSYLLFTSCKNEKTVDLLTEISSIENGLETDIQLKDEAPKQFNLSERMKYYKVPGVSIAVVKDGKIKWAKGYGIANSINGKKVDINTLFQAGSISKPLAALSALKLAEEGFIDLDQDINPYLTNWKIPNNRFTKDEKVTLRRLLSHTAGMTVSGFPGYQQSDTFPSIVTVLNGKGNSPAIYVDTIPGSTWRYSGGGYTVMEKLVEDISGLPFEEYMNKNILQPMGMRNSTYEQPLPPDRHSFASASYDNQGEIIDGLWHNYPEKAAAGLWTTPTDLAKYCIEIQEILSGKSTGILSKETVEMMLTRHKNNKGLGPSLKWDGDSLIFRHTGGNAGFKASMSAFAHRGDAAIIMTNADNGEKLFKEIVRSISNYYEWGISSPKIIEPIELAPEKPKVLIITTGGTIASRTGAPFIEGSELVHAVPQLRQYGDIEVEEFVRIGSSKMTPEIWLDLLKRINVVLNENPDLACIIITHGTDTMEETAFFLNLTHRRKTPIILVGSMRSSGEISADGPANLLNAVRVGISKEAVGKGVLVVLNDNISAGRDLLKMNNRRVDAFPSTELGFIGFADPDTVIFYRSSVKPHTTDSEFDILESERLPKVDIVRDFAGFDSEILSYFISRPNHGLVISSFAGGRLSSGMIEGLTNLPENHKPIVISSGIREGRIMGSNSPGSPIIIANDLPPNKVRILLMLSLTNTSDSKQIQDYFNKY